MEAVEAENFPFLPTLYVTQPGALVRHAHHRLLVEVGGRVVFGVVQITSRFPRIGPPVRV